ncbi:UPF0602 protein C4orf47 homolog [Echinops telfairi]|uniref:Cilia-and flagella-associated protein 96 n=1 Tax=Echinops telfairi TaxID=9371 RepID=A0ABM0ZTJ2_ECHTE|nr:UPF0602 protein C4orf47 homolog [Echinops telfairi]
MPGEGKSDMERIGLFSEMGYITVGDKYVSPFNPIATAITHSFILQQLQKQLQKWWCGFGSYYGTIGGPVQFFSAQLKPREQYLAPRKNLYTNPGKKGTGYGYTSLTIGKQPSHSADFYDESKVAYKKENEEHRHLLKGSPFKLNSYPREYFDANPYFLDKPLPPIKKVEKPATLTTPFKPSSPAKKDGGMKAGTFDPYPSHSVDSYGAKLLKQSPGKSDRIFHPPGGPKSRPVISIMTLNVKRALNMKNYKTASVQSY